MSETCRAVGRWFGAIDFEQIILSEDWSYRELVRKYGRGGAHWRISVIALWSAGTMVLILALLYRLFV